MAIRPSFSGHETFPLRFGWLKKALDAAVHFPATSCQYDGT